MTVFRSIRTRLTLWYAGIFAIILTASGMITYVISLSTLLNSLDDSLKFEIANLNKFIELKFDSMQKGHLNSNLSTSEYSSICKEIKNDIIDILWTQIYQHTLLSPKLHYTLILGLNNDTLYCSQNLLDYQINYDSIPYKTINIITTTGSNNQKIRLASMQNDYVKILIAYPLNQVYSTIDSIFLNFILILPLALLVSIISGWFLAHKSLKPVDELTKSAKEITVQNLFRRLPPYKVNDEIGRLTDQLNDMIDRLQGSFMQIQQFSADASHELRTPLTIMRGEIEVALRNQKMSKEMRNLLVSIYDELIRLSTIVETLMTLIKSDTGRMSLNMQTVPLNLIINQVFEKGKVLAEARRIKIKLEKNIPLFVKGDSARLKQLLLNIIDNAIKYTNPDGIVTLSLIREHSRAIVTIKDTGIGIPKKDLSKIFKRFYRVQRDVGKIKDTSGSGLGLSIAKWIAEAHQGSIIIRSKEGKGTTVIIQLPVLEEV